VLFYSAKLRNAANALKLFIVHASLRLITVIHHFSRLR